MEYKEQLKNQLWLDKRNRILQRDKFRCVCCGKESNLQVHHKRYIAGRFAWEYSDEDLITLCQECHRKIHNIPKKQFKGKITDLKKIDDTLLRPVFYRALSAKREGFTASELIMYSLYISQVVVSDENGYNQDSQTVNMDYWKRRLGKSQYMPIPSIRVCEFCKILGISKSSAINCRKRLEQKGIIGSDYIRFSYDILRKGYFELDTESGTKGELLIFYSFLKDKSSRYGYCIDTFKCKLAEQSDKSTISVKKMLNKLYKIGLIERMVDGKLKIKK